MGVDGVVDFVGDQVVFVGDVVVVGGLFVLYDFVGVVEVEFVLFFDVDGEDYWLVGVVFYCLYEVVGDQQ